MLKVFDYENVFIIAEYENVLTLWFSTCGHLLSYCFISSFSLQKHCVNVGRTLRDAKSVPICRLVEVIRFAFLMILHLRRRPILLQGGRARQVAKLITQIIFCPTIRYDIIRDAIFTCNQKLTWVSLIYSTEPTTEKWKNRKTKKYFKTDMLRSIGKQSGNPWRQSWRRKGKLRWGGFAEKEDLSLE